MRILHRLTQAAMAAILATTLGAVAADPVRAAPEPTGVTTAPHLQAQAEAFVAAANKLEPSIVRRGDGTLSLRTTAARAGVDWRAFRQVKDSIRVVNEHVRSGEWATTPDLGVHPAGPVVLHNGVILHWWGMEVHFDAFVTQVILNQLSHGGDAATIAGLLASIAGLGGMATAIAGVVILAGRVALELCANSNGLRLFKAHAGPPWCLGH